MTRAKRFKVWLTRFALTSGVEVAEALLDVDDEDPRKRMIIVFGSTGQPVATDEGRDWHRTRESAVRRVEEMRKAAIEAARRKLDKLTTMKVKVPK